MFCLPRFQSITNALKLLNVLLNKVHDDIYKLLANSNNLFIISSTYFYSCIQVLFISEGVNLNLQFLTADMIPPRWLWAHCAHWRCQPPHPPPGSTGRNTERDNQALTRQPTWAKMRQPSSSSCQASLLLKVLSSAFMKKLHKYLRSFTFWVPAYPGNPRMEEPKYASFCSLEKNTGIKRCFVLCSQNLTNFAWKINIVKLENGKIYHPGPGIKWSDCPRRRGNSYSYFIDPIRCTI